MLSRTLKFNLKPSKTITFLPNVLQKLNYKHSSNIKNETPVYILKSLTFHQRRMMAKTRLGCLPIRLETARYSIPRLTESERNCLVCKNSSFYPTNNPNLYHIESEIHYLFICNAYNVDRNEWLRKMNLPPDFDSLTIECKLKIVLNDPNNVKLTSQFITTAYNIRSKILN